MIGMQTATDSGTYALKDGFSQHTVEGIAGLVKGAYKAFDSHGFVALCLADFESLSLMARVRRVAQCLHRSLPGDYPAALAIVEAALGEPPQRSGFGEGIAAFRWAPFLEFVAVAGLNEPRLSLPALARLTRHFSAEFAIRPFLEHHRELTLDHVARLAMRRSGSRSPASRRAAWSATPCAASSRAATLGRWR